MAGAGPTAAMAAAAAFPPAVALVLPPETYLELYQHQGNGLAGTYAPLYNHYSDGLIDEDDLWAMTVVASSSTDVPQVFLFLALNPTNEYKVYCIHRPTMFKHHPVTASEYDGRAYCFCGYRDPEVGSIAMEIFPTNLCGLLPNTRVYTIDEMVTRVATLTKVIPRRPDSELARDTIIKTRARTDPRSHFPFHATLPFSLPQSVLTLRQSVRV